MQRRQPATIQPGWTILDRDQRRWFKVSLLPEEHPPETTQDIDALSQRGFDLLWRYVTQLERAPEVVAITLDQSTEIVSLSTDPQGDETISGVYPLLHEFPPVNTVLRSGLVELDRIGSSCDVVSHRDGPASGRTAVFKPALFNAPWTEMQVFLRLPPHPHILCIVLCSDRRDGA